LILKAGRVKKKRTVVVRQNVARATLQRLLSTWRNAFGLDSRVIGGVQELFPESVDGQRLRLGSDQRESAWSWEILFWSMPLLRNDGAGRRVSARIGLRFQSITHPGLSLNGTNTNGVIGERFWLVPDCLYSGSSCGLRDNPARANHVETTHIQDPANERIGISGPTIGWFMTRYDSGFL
jgi:hypothetical protein